MLRIYRANDFSVLKKNQKDPLDSYVWNKKIKLFYFDEQVRLFPAATN